jgi:hypothetical protein
MMQGFATHESNPGATAMQCRRIKLNKDCQQQRPGAEGKWPE